MTQITNNPLRQFFRQPAIYIKLPSNGQHWPLNSLAMPGNGELAVFPMTAIDEITYRTPDALFNGQAVINVIQSCVPAVKDAGKIPGCDLNTLLVAIRIASYGHDMETASRCPECQHEDEFSVDLRGVMDRIKYPDYNTHMDQGDLQIYFKPVSYEDQNAGAMEQFERQKYLQNLAETDLTEEERNQLLSQSLKDITYLTVNLIAKGIAAIKIPSAVVDDTDSIKEFLLNCDNTLFKKIRDHVIDLTQQTQLQPLNIQCSECNHQYQQDINLDLASFFGSAS